MESEKAALLSPKVFIDDMNEKIVKCIHIYTKAITLRTTTKNATTFCRRLCHTR